jgi:hypothetical protein
MNTRPYPDLLGLVEALCGATLAEQERVRIRYFVNRRAQRAYAATELWPRFLVVGEERVVSEGGLLPYEQPALADIGTVLRIHATRPFLADPAREYGEFYAATAGIQITGYQPAQVVRVTPDMLVTGTLAPDATGRFEFGTTVTGPMGGTASEYRLSSNPTLTITPVIAWVDGVDYVTWFIGDDQTYTDCWQANAGVAVPLSESPTPDGLTYSPVGTNTGYPTVTVESLYSAFITYKAALTATYGSNAGDTTGFPEEWFEYAAHGAYADFLRNEGQQDKALVAEAEATEILQEQLEKVSRQGGARVATRVMNHANHQSR